MTAVKVTYKIEVTAVTEDYQDQPEWGYGAGWCAQIGLRQNYSR